MHVCVCVCVCASPVRPRTCVCVCFTCVCVCHRYGTGAPACLTLTHYTELLDSVGLVLVRGDIVNDKLVSQAEVSALHTRPVGDPCMLPMHVIEATEATDAAL